MMKRGANSFHLGSQPTLFEAGCPHCPLYGACGGGRSAPCHCMYPSSSTRYRQCARCPYICRERSALLKDGSVDTLQRRLLGLQTLDDVAIAQTNNVRLPVFIADKTCELPKGYELPLQWAAVGLKRLPLDPNRHCQSGACWFSAENLSRCMRVSPSTRLLPILNGADDVLEAFWGSDRAAFFELLKSQQITTITAPTFSVHEIDRMSGRPIPESERVVNMMRHHRVLQELGEYFAVPIPNLYWRHERDISTWVTWLQNNPEVNCISRDLTCRGQRDIFLTNLLSLVKRVGRPLHIVLLGIGIRRAAKVVQDFAAIGCTVSIVTANPILSAIKGGRAFRFQGSEAPVVETDSGRSRPALALHNLDVTIRHFNEVINRLDVYSAEDQIQTFQTLRNQT